MGFFLFSKSKMAATNFSQLGVELRTQGSGTHESWLCWPSLRVNCKPYLLSQSSPTLRVSPVHSHRSRWEFISDRVLPSYAPKKTRLIYLACATLFERGVFFNWLYGLIPWELVSDHVVTCSTLENKIHMSRARNTSVGGHVSWLAPWPSPLGSL